MGTMTNGDSSESILISILMNCYNGETYLHEAIESVFAQTYQNWELIFWDNQSTDRSSEIVNDYSDKRIKYFFSSTHSILGDARRDAIKKAKGEWIGILDCDDAWYPTKLQDQLDIIQEERQKDILLGLVYGRVMGLDKKSNETIEIGHMDYINKPLPEGEILQDLLINGNFIVGPSILFNINAFHKIGGFPKGYLSATDYYLSCAISSQYNVRAVNRYISKYRVHGNNLTRKEKIITYEEQLKIFNHWKKYLNVSENKKLQRIQEINVYAALMMIKYDKQFLSGFLRILKHGSFLYAIKYILEYFFKKKMNIYRL